MGEGVFRLGWVGLFMFICLRVMELGLWSLELGWAGYVFIRRGLTFIHLLGI